MVRPDHADAETQQTEYELQPQEYDPNHEPTPNIPDEYNQQAQQQQFQQPPPNQAYPQQQFPPQQPMPPQYPPQQPNQAYPPPQRAAPYPPQNMQYNPNTAYQQPAAAAYPPQPVQFPPKSPGTNQMYANVGPQGVQTQTGYAPNASPQAFPQPAFLPNDQNMQPPSPYKPGGQPPSVAGIPVGPGGVNGWRSGLFDFMDDPMNALVTAFFPCLTFGQIAEIVDDGHTTCGTSGMLYGGIAFCIGMPCILSCTYRTKLRNKFGLPEAPAPDWITHFLCEWCALCQEYRELQHRGWDPSIGWQGNMARNQRQQPVMMAPVNQTMMG